ncbi:hypothetical protein VXM60_03710 [Shewanella khirikhana]|uniref:hypothetical protein n=1 Tax=Shewanella khirikhana TaxID=1965282 RepID=UPI0030CA877D
MKKYINHLLAGAVFTSAVAMPFMFVKQDAAEQEQVLKVSMCEPFPECYIYKIDEAPAVNNEL